MNGRLCSEGGTNVEDIPIVWSFFSYLFLCAFYLYLYCCSWTETVSFLSDTCWWKRVAASNVMIVPVPSSTHKIYRDLILNMAEDMQRNITTNNPISLNLRDFFSETPQNWFQGSWSSHWWARRSSSCAQGCWSYMHGSCCSCSIVEGEGIVLYVLNSRAFLCERNDPHNEIVRRWKYKQDLQNWSAIRNQKNSCHARFRSCPNKSKSLCSMEWCCQMVDQSSQIDYFDQFYNFLQSWFCKTP